MGIFDFFRRKRPPNERSTAEGAASERAQPGGDDAANAEPAGDSGAPSVAGLGNARALRAGGDDLTRFKELPLAAGVKEAMAHLDRAPSDRGASEVLRWLRSVGDTRELPAASRLALADWFAARDESEVSRRILMSATAGFDTVAASAWARLAELAERAGRPEESARCYEEVLAIDATWPGARERYARTRAPTRAGGAGATLISPDSARVGQGRYALVRELGRGGAGAVYLASDSHIGRDVAFKIYHPGRGSARLERLRNEAGLASSLASRHIVRVFDMIEDLGAITMEHCAGGSMKSAIVRREGSASERRAWLRGVAHALWITHEAGFVHRDLKPGNVLLRSDGTAVVTDFGIAVRAGAAFAAFEGTPGYTAPEVRHGAVADPRMDVFAFGALARELISEQTPELTRWISSCLAPDASQRPADGRALLGSLSSMEINA